MRTTYAVSWEDSKKPFAAAFVAILLIAALAAVPQSGAFASLSSSSAGGAGANAVAAGKSVSVIVTKVAGSHAAPEQLVNELGGHVERPLEIINGFSAEIPRSQLDRLRAAAGVSSVTRNRKVQLLSDPGEYDSTADAGSMYRTAESIGATDYWQAGYTGQGVGIALIDSGVVPVEGLTYPGKVINGPDLSLEAPVAELRYLDSFGHGTHMAGIIAGRDGGLTDAEIPTNRTEFSGIAPGARLLSVKVADAVGSTDVSQVIAAIDWVVQHRNDNGMNIRVINLSFGTDSIQPAESDPLAYAAEVAWQQGIVVVVAAGNRGYGSPKLNMPALHPRLLAVGASVSQGTRDKADDTLADFSSKGDATRPPDLVAPGKSITSLRNPGSFVDANFPGGVVGSRFFKGSGTSQAAAVVSGAAALIIQQHPDISPDQVKGLLRLKASPIEGSPPGQGTGVINLTAALDARPRRGSQGPTVWGQFSLEASRGTGHLQTETGVVLMGEQDIFGMPFDSSAWKTKAAQLLSWTGGWWNGSQWIGDSWTIDAWGRTSWAGIEWTRNSWSGEVWNRNSWSRNSWSNGTWAGDSWARNTWSGDSWARNTWSTGGWD